MIGGIEKSTLHFQAFVWLLPLTDLPVEARKECSILLPLSHFRLTIYKYEILHRLDYLKAPPS